MKSLTDKKKAQRRKEIIVDGIVISIYVLLGLGAIAWASLALAQTTLMKGVI